MMVLEACRPFVAAAEVALEKAGGIKMQPKLGQLWFKGH
jgi:hypothetical protein